MTWPSRRRELTSQQIELAKSQEHFPFRVTDMAAVASWEKMEEAASAEIKRRGIDVLTKQRGLRNWRAWSENATMIPMPRGPMLLPWDWAKRSIRHRAPILWHELGHHDQDRGLVAYEAMWADPGWRLALEGECYGISVWMKVLASRFRRKPYTNAELARYIVMRARTMRSGYFARRYPQGHVTEAMIEVLNHHAEKARAHLFHPPGAGASRRRI